jgi:hypothetical protein
MRPSPGRLALRSQSRVEASYVPKWKPDAFCTPHLEAILSEARINWDGDPGVQVERAGTLKLI